MVEVAVSARKAQWRAVGRPVARSRTCAPDSAARVGATPAQGLVVLVLLAGLALAFSRWPAAAARVGIVSVALGFLACGVWRVLLVLCSGHRPPSPPRPRRWPRYTILAALHDEVAVVPQLVARLAAIDYPRDRLEGWLVLEADDLPTIQAVRDSRLPSWLGLILVPPGRPRTKPRALNHALARVTGELLTVYDAEDAPDPAQLREAAARFAADGRGRLACLQAPLRIRSRGDRPGFLERQFAAEYAALFEVVLPALTRLGLPFPLGGTSNHFRTDVLRAVGGWDAWNVTEDADLGFRLWRRGWRLGVLSRPTWETPPATLEQWLPQRVRWLKGYMQTWGVHSRDPAGLGLRGLVSLVMTLGMALVSAALHAPSLAWITTAVLIAAVAGLSPATPVLALAVLGLGAAAAWLTCAIGARRAGLPYHLRDMVTAPAYWSLLSLAFVHAVWRLIREPFAWDKTRHTADPEAVVDTSSTADSGRQAA
jgi:cellulose synthase/poly-beta-1,6-N-acetylglucosamine synthase-like glycosyltransferase